MKAKRVYGQVNFYVRVSHREIFELFTSLIKKDEALLKSYKSQNYQGMISVAIMSLIIRYVKEHKHLIENDDIDLEKFEEERQKEEGEVQSG